MNLLLIHQNFPGQFRHFVPIRAQQASRRMTCRLNRWSGGVATSLAHNMPLIRSESAWGVVCLVNRQVLDRLKHV